MRRGGRQAWLLVKKADEFADGDPVKTSPQSVKSGKTIGQRTAPEFLAACVTGQREHGSWCRRGSRRGRRRAR
jgi:hypothetical protein